MKDIAHARHHRSKQICIGPAFLTARGLLTVSAEIVHGKLAVTVVDTGLGFGKAMTQGTGIGLSNIRERLNLLYGNKASLVVTEPGTGGTSVTITVPYVAHTDGAATT